MIGTKVMTAHVVTWTASAQARVELEVQACAAWVWTDGMIWRSGSIPIHTIFRGMNIHLPGGSIAIYQGDIPKYLYQNIQFTSYFDVNRRGIGFWPIPICFMCHEVMNLKGSLDGTSDGSSPKLDTPNFPNLDDHDQWNQWTKLPRSASPECFWINNPVEPRNKIKVGALPQYFFWHVGLLPGFQLLAW